jgi:peptidoglycan lytic transglycosylase
MAKESRALTVIRCAPLIWAALAFSSCRPKVETLPPGGYVETGIASWYGEEFHGRKTSSLEVYDMNDLTAAHNRLPLGTFVAVTNLNNGRSVIVRINDRGPFVKNRVIDLSFAAARAIDMVGTGTAPVRIEALPGISPPLKALSFSVQAGSFVGQENAEALRGQLAGQFADVTVSTFATPQQIYYRVRIRAKDRETAETIARALLEKGYSAIIFEEK